MNNTIETNQGYQKFKEILTAKHIISQWLSAGSVLLRQVISLSAATAASQPVSQSPRPSDCYLLVNKVGQSWCTIQYLRAAN